MKKTNSNPPGQFVRQFIWVMGITLLFSLGCTKDHINVIDDNNPASVTNSSPDSKSKNYVNRLLH
ncbi:MAG: hypothetical protein IPI30_21550 [Saprospiraceae bacterium]|nr:hypothetical protein [Candidatus Vicinibacter affinis]